MEFTSKATRPFEFVDTYCCYYSSIVIQIFYMGIKFCDIQYLDWIVRYIVLRKATRFVSVWSIISIFSSSVEKKKDIFHFIRNKRHQFCYNRVTTISTWTALSIEKVLKTKKTCLCFHHHPHLHHPRHHHHLTIRLSHLHQECLWSKTAEMKKKSLNKTTLL